MRLYCVVAIVHIKLYECVIICLRKILDVLFVFLVSGTMLSEIS